MYTIKFMNFVNYAKEKKNLLAFIFQFHLKILFFNEDNFNIYKKKIKTRKFLYII